MAGWEVNRDRDMLERIVALLFALAGLADLAAGASFLRRRRVIGILDCGEVEARAFVIGMVCGAPVPVDALERTDDAAQLALRLRALALMLCLVLARRIPLPGAGVTRAGRHKPAMQVDRQVAPPAPPPSDTS